MGLFRKQLTRFVSCAPWPLALTVTLGESGAGSRAVCGKRRTPVSRWGLRGLAVTARETRGFLRLSLSRSLSVTRPRIDPIVSYRAR